MIAGLLPAPRHGESHWLVDESSASSVENLRHRQHMGRERPKVPPLCTSARVVVIVALYPPQQSFCQWKLASPSKASEDDCLQQLFAPSILREILGCFRVLV